MAANLVHDLAYAITAACAARDIEETRAALPPKPPVPRRKGPPIDFHAVPAHQYPIDGRLRNWGSWCNGTAAASSSPMFRLAQSTARSRGDRPVGLSNVDRSDAVRIAQAVTALPEKHAAALNWCYVKPVGPKRACEAIGTSFEGLAALLYEGRQMLINRGF